MGVSTRCTGFNLLNHCKQVSKPKQLEYTFTQLKENNMLVWKVDLNIDNSHYYATGKKQREALLTVINDNETLLRDKLIE